MKRIIILIIMAGVFLVNAGYCNAYVRVRGYFRSTGSYVMPHFRTNSNSFKWDNWSSKGNVNPFTGKRGYRNW